MLSTREYRQLQNKGKNCPYGRVAKVGSTRCINCTFNRIDNATTYDKTITSCMCIGDEEKMKTHLAQPYFAEELNAQL